MNLREDGEANSRREKQSRVSKYDKTNEFRWKAADFIANNIRLAQGASVIQSNLLNQTSEEDSRQQKICKFCNCVLTETCHSRLLPKKVPGAKLKKLIQKAQSLDSDAWGIKYRRFNFSKFELSLLKKCKSRPANTLVLTCSICRKSQKYPLRPCYRSPRETKKPIQPKVTTSKKNKKERKKGAKPNAGLKLVNTTKHKPQNLTSVTPSNKNMKSSTVTLPKKNVPESTVKLVAPQQQNVNKPLLKIKGKVEKPQGTPKFIKKLKNGNKLASLIAQDAASKKAKKNNPRSNIFALLHGWVGK